jgi:hypothetical protein
MIYRGAIVADMKPAFRQLLADAGLSQKGYRDLIEALTGERPAAANVSRAACGLAEPHAAALALLRVWAELPAAERWRILGNAARRDYRRPDDFQRPTPASRATLSSNA